MLNKFDIDFVEEMRYISFTFISFTTPTSLPCQFSYLEPVCYGL